MALTALDIVVLLAVGIGAVGGFVRGFVADGMALLAWIAAVIAVRLFHGIGGALLEKPVGTSAGAAVLSFAIIFGVTFLGVRLLGRSLGKTTKASALAPIDRVLGLGLGALKGLIGVTLGFLFLSLLYDVRYGQKAERPEWMTDSQTYPLIRASAEAISRFVEERRDQ